MDDGIRERHGCTCRDRITNGERFATLQERGQTVVVTVNDCELTEWQARYLAAKLYRLSRRIRNRREAAEASNVASIAA